MTAINHTIGPEDAGRTLEAMLRRLLPGHSWEQVRKVVAARRVRLGRPPAVDLCMDSARRVHAGEMVQINERSAPPVARPGGLVIRYLDSQVVVVEKPSGLNTSGTHRSANGIHRGVNWFRVSTRSFPGRLPIQGLASVE